MQGRIRPTAKSILSNKRVTIADQKPSTAMGRAEEGHFEAIGATATMMQDKSCLDSPSSFKRQAGIAIKTAKRRQDQVHFETAKDGQRAAPEEVSLLTTKRAATRKRQQ